MSQNVPKCPIGADDADQDDVLSSQQNLAVELLLGGNSLGAISRSMKIDRRTLYRWRTNDPEFRAALARRRRELWRDNTDRIRGLLAPAIDVMAEHLADKYDRSRFKAANALLRMADVKSMIKHVSDAEVEDDGG